MLEMQVEKQIWICNIVCPMQQNIDTKWRDKLIRYEQLPLEMRERSLGYTFMVLPIIIGALGGDMKKKIKKSSKVLTKQEKVVKSAAKMQKTTLMDSETLLGKVFSGLVQSGIEENIPFS